MNQQSIFGRFFTSYLWITTALVILIGLYGCYLMRRFYLDQTETDLETRARLCAKQLAPPLGAGDFAAVDALCKELGNLMDTRITVVLDSGKVVGDTNKDPQQMEDHSNRAEIRQAKTEGMGSATHHSRTLNEERMYVAVAINDDASGAAFVRTSVTIPSINRTLAALYGDFILAGLIIAAVITAIALWTSLRISRSLEAAMARGQMSLPKELRHRYPDLEPEEISELNAAVERSAEQLAADIRAARRQGDGP